MDDRRFQKWDLLRWMRHNLIPSPRNGWRLFRHGKLLYIDYKIQPTPRYGHGKPPHPQLHAILNRRRDHYIQLLAAFSAYFDRFKAMADSTEPGPSFDSTYFYGLDAVALYSFIRMYRPQRYIEIGSGNSTYFARAAVQDEGLPTIITAIDAKPRRNIHAVADEVLACYLEQVDLALFDSLEANDILFLDGSHRSFTNSDVTILFLEILPRLKPGVFVHIHDIFLPDDYPPAWNNRYYSEQYLLACYLLAETQQFEVFFPVYFVLTDHLLQSHIASLWSLPEKGELTSGGVSFWIRMR